MSVWCGGGGGGGEVGGGGGSGGGGFGNKLHAQMVTAHTTHWVHWWIYCMCR